MTQKTTAYMSFLGAGFYKATTYDWDGTQASETPYVQEAELELLLKRGEIEPSTPVIIFGTKTSNEAHWERRRGFNPRTGKYGGDEGEGLRPRLKRLGWRPTFVEISEDLSAAEQWSTFQAVLTEIPRGSHLAVDMTHGYRSVPVVFSSALHFLRLARDVTLTHVLYGAYEVEQDASPIMDYVDFYAIQDWTDAVSRLVEDADARRLVELSTGHTSLPVAAFSAELTDALMQITDAVRNVEVHGIEQKVRAALELVRAATAKASDEPASKALLDLVEGKFEALAGLPPLDGHYTPDYFELQRRFIALLLEHRLFMQAFTAMREYVGSLGLRAYKPGKLKFDNSDGRKKRGYADVFLSMVAFPREDWSFTPQRRKQVDNLLPHYEQLVAADLLEEMRANLKVITDIRNGFDHAWTKRQVPEEIAASGTKELESLTRLTSQILALGPPAQPAPARDAKPRLLVLMNHEPTEAQVADASASWNVSTDAWLRAPEALNRAWADVDAAAERTPPDLLALLDAWLDAEAKAGDLFWVQGELGATLTAARRARDRGLTCIYATSRRESVTTPEADGSVTKTSRFVHVRFRELPR